MEQTFIDAASSGAQSRAPILSFEDFEDQAVFAAFERLTPERRAALATRFVASAGCDREGSAAGDLRALIDAEPTVRGLELLSHDLWTRHYPSGTLTDDEAQLLAERIEARKKARRETSSLRNRAPDVRASALEAGRPSHFPPKRPVPKPKCRKTAWTRKRMLGSSGAMPPAMAGNFTNGQLAVLMIVGTEAAKHGACRLSLSEIMCRAGLRSVTTVRDAIRAAVRQGLLCVHERRRDKQPNLTNSVEVICKTWLAWLRRGGAAKVQKAALPRKEVGSKKVRSTDKGSYRTSNSERPSVAQHTYFSPRTAYDRQSIGRDRGG
jgi:hypothetical protein